MTANSPYGSLVPFVVPGLENFAFEGAPLGYDADARVHLLIAGDSGRVRELAMFAALSCHYPNYERDNRLRTRISIVCGRSDAEDLRFEFAELFDNSWWRSVDLSGNAPAVTVHAPLYHGRRADFTDIEWEFIEGRLSNPLLQQKIKLWAADPRQRFTVALCYDDASRNLNLGARIASRLGCRVIADAPESAPGVHAYGRCADAEALVSRYMAMARYLNYFYEASYNLGAAPVELPEDKVEAAWAKVAAPELQLSNIYNVMTMPCKMRTLGHDRSQWDTFYAVSARETEALAATEHNRWSVERLIQGTRPCTDAEREAVMADISLKKKYKKERNAHFDLVAFDELGVDETGLPVERYDRALIAAIPLIVSTYNNRRHE